MHTPGEWTCGPEENAGGGMTIVAQVGGKPARIAHTSRVVYGGREVVSDAEAKANARLLAAAPDLLDAVTALLVDNHGGEPPCPCSGCKAARSMALAAIAKAEGRQ